MADAAVIFDVDGVLLNLTRDEVETFFATFRLRYGLTDLSRDWNGYPIRNDENIIEHILAVNGLPASDSDHVIADYLKHVSATLAPVEIPGARALLENLSGIRLGIATANLREAARLRLAHLDLWRHVSTLAFGADGGGHKRDILARAIAHLDVPKERIVFVGDNTNDVDAGLANGVHFVGFSVRPERLPQLAAAGARHLCGGHQTTLKIIRDLLGGL